MQLDQYLRILIRRWYVPLLLVGLTALGVFIHGYITGNREAEVVINVPLAEVTTFDSVMNGKMLGDRVATRLNDGSSGGDISDHLSGGFKKDTGRLTPLYAIHARAKDGDRAILLANTAAAEGMKLFEDSKDVTVAFQRASFQQDMNQAESDVATARAALNQFLAQNNAYALETRIAQQTALVSRLRDQADLGSGITARGVAPESSDEADARRELDRLTALQPAYNDLTMKRDLALGDMQRLESEAAALEQAGAGFENALDFTNQQLNGAKLLMLAAQSAVADFSTANNITDLPLAITQQQDAVNDAIVSSTTTSGAQTDRLLKNADLNLSQLQALQPEYDRLNHALDLAQSVLAARQQQELTLIERSFSPDTRPQLVSAAELQSDLWWTAIKYSVAIGLALLVAMTVIYGLAFFERDPISIEQIGQEFGRPVIGYVPHGGRQEAQP